MNSAPDGGRNLQTVFPASTVKRGFGIKAVSTSGPNPTPQALFTCSAQRRWASRPYRYRWVDKLKPWQVDQLHVADSIARLDQLPLTLFVTIRWVATSPGTALMPYTFRRGMKCMGQWLRDRGVRKFAFCYVHENPEGKLNSHLLVHVPARLRGAFYSKASDWFYGLDGVHGIEKGVDVAPRNKPGQPDKRLAYMAKGADDLTCRRYGGRRFRGGQGIVHILRSGVAQCLRPKAIAFRDTAAQEASA